MRRASALPIAAAVLAIVGCGSSGAQSPTQIGDEWYSATAAGDGAKLCALSTADRQARFIEIGKRLPGGKDVTTCAAAVNLTLKHFGGGERLGKLAHVHVTLISKSSTTAEVRAPNAAPLKLEKSGSSWRVSGAGTNNQ